MKKIIVPALFLVAIIFSSCNMGTTAESQENVDSLKQVEDVITSEMIDSASAVSDTLEAPVEGTVAQ